MRSILVSLATLSALLWLSACDGDTKSGFVETGVADAATDGAKSDGVVSDTTSEVSAESSVGDGLVDSATDDTAADSGDEASDAN